MLRGDSRRAGSRDKAVDGGVAAGEIHNRGEKGRPRRLLTCMMANGSCRCTEGTVVQGGRLRDDRGV